MSPASLALAGGFFITEPPGKSQRWMRYHQMLHFSKTTRETVEGLVGGGAGKIGVREMN